MPSDCHYHGSLLDYRILKVPYYVFVPRYRLTVYFVGTGCIIKSSRPGTEQRNSTAGNYKEKAKQKHIMTITSYVKYQIIVLFLSHQQTCLIYFSTLYFIQVQATRVGSIENSKQVCGILVTGYQ